MNNWGTENQVSFEGFVTKKQDILNDTAKMPMRWKESHGLGIANTWLDEPVPKFPWNKEGGVRYIVGKNNTMIELGRDMPNSHWSGHGGSGHTRAGSIDLVCGRQAPNMKETAMVGKNFTDDSARVYIAQKTDIDTNFGVDPGQIGMVANRSGVGIKADAVRVISRDGGIKLITGNAQNTRARSRTGAGEGSPLLQALDSVFGERNSVGGFGMSPAPGIELIAGNNSESQTTGFIGRMIGGDDTIETLQPVIMGDNLVEALKDLVEIIDELSGTVHTLASAQRKFNTQVVLHTHIPRAEVPSLQLIGAAFPMYVRYLNLFRKGLSHKVGMALWKMNYTFPLATRYICSENVRTT